MNILTSLMEVGIGFIGFATIVVAIQMSMGKPLTKYEVLLTHFYIETGLLSVGLTGISVALIDVLGDELLVWRISTYACLFTLMIYAPYYGIRRRRVQEPVPLTSLVVMIGYGILFFALALTATELIWAPSMAIVITVVMWGLGSSSLIFVMMLGQFLKEGEAR
jgi:hypothetical protein